MCARPYSQDIQPNCNCRATFEFRIQCRRRFRPIDEVVLTTRCYEGLVLEDSYGFAGSEKNLREIGVIVAPGLNGQKARIKLILALSYTRDLHAIRDMFNAPIKYG